MRGGELGRLIYTYSFSQSLTAEECKHLFLLSGVHSMQQTSLRKSPPSNICAPFHESHSSISATKSSATTLALCAVLLVCGFPFLRRGIDSVTRVRAGKEGRLSPNGPGTSTLLVRAPPCISRTIAIDTSSG